MKYKWYYSDNQQGISVTWDDAYAQLCSRIPWLDYARINAHTEYGYINAPDDTIYFYETEDDAVDDDGAYTPSITTLKGKY